MRKNLLDKFCASLSDKRWRPNFLPREDSLCVAFKQASEYSRSISHVQDRVHQFLFCEGIVVDASRSELKTAHFFGRAGSYQVIPDGIVGEHRDREVSHKLGPSSLVHGGQESLIFSPVRSKEAEAEIESVNWVECPTNIMVP